MASTRVCLWLLFMIITQIVGEDTRSMIMSLMINSMFQCANTTCLSFINVITSNVRNCQFACLVRNQCRAATFHQSASNCELFNNTLSQNESMLADVDATSMNVISETRCLSEPSTISTSTTTTTTTTTPIPKWIMTGNMSAARFSHTASTLANGLVLVTGGNGNAGYLNSAELYNPSSGTWTTTGNMSLARYLHAASTLVNGSVLVTGGYTVSSSFNSTELYNSLTGTWTTTGRMNTERYLHTASTLANGSVLVTGGNSNAGYLNSAELYNPLTGTWTTTGSMNATRQYHTASTLANGSVLVAGGYNGTFLNSAEFYNPLTGTWTTTGS
ncbi:unnamed protein product, partial [Adineta steineri]